MDSEVLTNMLDKVFAYSVCRTFSREEAEELSQEIMFQAVRSLNTIKDESKFEPWFWQVANITLKVFKRGKARSRNCFSFNEITPPVYEDEYVFENEEIHQRLRRQISSLSASYRDIIVMYYYDNITCKDIAKKLCLPEGTVTYRLSQARNKLKKECSTMNETALKPIKLDIRISGEGNYNGTDRPFPWQYICDALSQNILWYSYRKPKTVEELSNLTGVPAFYIENCIDSLIKREAVIKPTKTTIQTDFLIFDDRMSEYSRAHATEFAESVENGFYESAQKLVAKTVNLGIKTAGRSADELLCLFSLLALDELVPKYRPAEFKKPAIKYDGSMWEYHANVSGMVYDGGGLGMNKNMNNGEPDSYMHYVYHYSPFVAQKMMYDHELRVCKILLENGELSEKQKENAAEMLASGYLRKNENGKIKVSMPVFSAEQYAEFKKYIYETFSDFIPLYSEQLKKYVSGYLEVFPAHLKDQANRNGFYLFVSMFTKVSSIWLAKGKITIPDGAICDVLIKR